MTLMCYSRCVCWWYLCSYVALDFGTTCSLFYLVENRASCDVLAETVRPLSFQAKFRLGSLTVSMSTCLNDFHSGLLSKGPEESAFGWQGGTHTTGPKVHEQPWQYVDVTLTPKP